MISELELASPGDVGVDAERLQALIDRAGKEVDEGLLPACQVALAREGKLVAFETFGDATPATRFVIFSATKAWVASTVWMFLQEGSLKLDQRVAEMVPEFGTNGKDVITLEQVMLHTSGFPRQLLNPLKWDDKEARYRAFDRWELDWEPGTAFEYHATSAHWVLAELLERVTGRDFRDVVRERLVEPLGLPSFVLGGDGAKDAEVAQVRQVGEPMTPDELEAMIGIRELPITEVTPEATSSISRMPAREVGIPGGGGLATAADIALFYQELIHNSKGLWDSGFLADATSHVRNNFPDIMFRTPASRGLGVVIAGDDGLGHMRGFGKSNTPSAFGHGGAGGQIAWADPGTGLSFGYVTNGMDEHLLRQARRGVGLSSRAANCAS
ncbi:MAG: serine hydrolase domain-containing protein [Actinomycetota bacterium]